MGECVGEKLAHMCACERSIGACMSIYECIRIRALVFVCAVAGVSVRDSRFLLDFDISLLLSFLFGEPP